MCGHVTIDTIAKRGRKNHDRSTAVYINIAGVRGRAWPGLMRHVGGTECGWDGRCGKTDGLLRDGEVDRFAKSHGFMLSTFGGKLIALSSVCSYRDCTLEISSGQNGFNCPCHGCQYDRFGSVRKGPAHNPLVHFVMSLNGGAACHGGYDAAADSAGVGAGGFLSDRERVNYSSQPLRLSGSMNLIGVARVGDGEFGGVPLQLFAGAIGGVAEQHGFGQRAAVIEIAGGGGAVFAGFDPFGVVADRFGNGMRRGGEIFVAIFGQELQHAIIGGEHAFVADEERAVAPFKGIAGFGKDGRVFVAVVPGEMDGRLIAAGGEVVIDLEIEGGAIGSGAGPVASTVVG